MLESFECYIPFISEYNYTLSISEMRLALNLFSVQIRVLYDDLKNEGTKLQYDLMNSFEESENDTGIQDYTNSVSKTVLVRKKRLIQKPFTSPKTIIQLLKYHIIYY